MLAILCYCYSCAAVERHRCARTRLPSKPRSSFVTSSSGSQYQLAREASPRTYDSTNLSIRCCNFEQYLPLCRGHPMAKCAVPSGGAQLETGKHPVHRCGSRGCRRAATQSQQADRPLAVLQWNANRAMFDAFSCTEIENVGEARTTDYALDLTVPVLPHCTLAQPLAAATSSGVEELGRPTLHGKVVDWIQSRATRIHVDKKNSPRPVPPQRKLSHRQASSTSCGAPRHRREQLQAQTHACRSAHPWRRGPNPSSASSCASAPQPVGPCSGKSAQTLAPRLQDRNRNSREQWDRVTGGSSLGLVPSGIGKSASSKNRRSEAAAVEITRSVAVEPQSRVPSICRRIPSSNSV